MNPSKPSTLMACITAGTWRPGPFVNMLKSRDMAPAGKKILTQAQVRSSVEGMAKSIEKQFPGLADKGVFVGIQRRGVPLAKRLAESLENLGFPRLPVGQLDITFYRDDMHEISLHPVVHDTDIPFDLDGKTVFLVDDVLFTGRTIRSA